jgi:hypothetical protein
MGPETTGCDGKDARSADLYSHLTRLEGKLNIYGMKVVAVGPSGQLVQLVKALGSLPKVPGVEPDLAQTHITCLLSVS